MHKTLFFSYQAFMGTIRIKTTYSNIIVVLVCLIGDHNSSIVDLKTVVLVQVTIGSYLRVNIFKLVKWHKKLFPRDKNIYELLYLFVSYCDFVFLLKLFYR